MYMEKRDTILGAVVLILTIILAGYTFFDVYINRYTTMELKAKIIKINYGEKVEVLLETNEYGILYYKANYPFRYKVGDIVVIKIMIDIKSGEVSVIEIIDGGD